MIKCFHCLDKSHLNKKHTFNKTGYIYIYIKKILILIACPLNLNEFRINEYTIHIFKFL